MNRTKATKPYYNFINPETIHDEIIQCVRDKVLELGYDINDYKQRKAITHNEMNYIFRSVYDRLFKPEKPLYNNQKSKLNYDDINTMQIVVDSFLDICSWFNKSLGLMSFSYMSGITTETMLQWVSNGDELNIERSLIVKKLRECHKASQVALLNDTPVGALAVANNDNETGLNWSRQQALEQANNAVYLIPSERLNKLGIDKSTQGIESGVTQV